MTLELVEGFVERDAPSLAQAESTGEAAHTDRIKEAALSSSAVRDALRILGGSVEEIRVLADGKVS